MSRTNSIIGIAVFIIGVIIYSSTFVIREDEQALVLQFGDPRRELKEAGLNFKVPFIQDAVFFDKRVLDFDASAAEVPTLDQKQLVVDSFARYRIVDPLKFYQTVVFEANAEAQINNIISAALRDAFGKELFTLLPQIISIYSFTQAKAFFRCKPF